MECQHRQRDQRVKFHADIRGSCLERRRQTTPDCPMAIFFTAFRVYIFGGFRNNANIIILFYLVLHWLSSDAKTDDLDSEWLLYVCYYDHFAHFADEQYWFLLCDVWPTLLSLYYELEVKLT